MALPKNKVFQVFCGQSRFIQSHEDVGEVIADFFTSLDIPILTDISIIWKDDSGQQHQNWLVLMTCFPFNYPGDAPKRMLVWAKEDNS